MFQSRRAAIGVGVFDQGDGLALSRVTGVVQRSQVIDGLGVLRRHRVAGTRFGWGSGRQRCSRQKVYFDIGLFMAWGLKSLREKIPATTGASDAGIMRIAHVGDMRFAADLKLPDLGVEGLADLARRAREVDQHAGWCKPG